MRKSDLNRKNRETAADRTLDAAWKNLWERYPGSAIYPVTKRNRGAQLVLNETGENFRPPLPVLQLRKGNGAFWRLQGFILVFRKMGVCFSILFFPMIVAIAQPQDNPIQYALYTLRIRKEEMKLLLPSCLDNPPHYGGWIRKRVKWLIKTIRFLTISAGGKHAKSILTVRILYLRRVLSSILGLEEFNQSQKQSPLILPLTNAQFPEFQSS